MDVNGNAYIMLAHHIMSESKTTVISVRIPRDIAEWLNSKGGSTLIKSIIYAYIFTQTVGAGCGKKAQLIQSVIEESIDTLPPPPEINEDEIPRTISFE